MVKIYAVGTAGSGKSTFIGAFAEWMEEQGFRVSVINLDPGAEELQYEPDIDIREWFTLPQIMKEYGLGPNGAQIAGADMVATKIDEIRDELERTDYDYALIDTPGQVELFAFRASSSEITRRLGEEDSMLAFLFDPIISKEPSGFASLLMLSATVHFRFSLPFVNLLGKSDLLSHEERERILDWSTGEDSLYNALREQRDMRGNFNLEIFKALENLGTYRKLIPLSSLTGEGIPDVYSIAQGIFGAGEDLTAD